MTAEQYWEDRGFVELDKYGKQTKMFDYFDMIDFAEEYHGSKTPELDLNTHLKECECLITEPKQELDCFPYGDNCKWDVCTKCGKIHNLITF